MEIFLLILGLVLFVALVIVHELGHFWVARRNGVVPEEFGIFFPPTLWRKKMKSGWDFTMNALPLGGFVKLRGEHDSDTAKGSFGAASDWAKTKIMLAGVAVNLVTALILFTILAWVGMPSIIPDQFTVKNDTTVSQNSLLAQYVEPGSPAQKAGINRGDELQSIYVVNEQKLYTITSEDTLSVLTKKLAGQPVEVRFMHRGEPRKSKVNLLSNADIAASVAAKKPKGRLGVTAFPLKVQRSTWSAPIVAIGISWQITKLTFQGIGHALKGLVGIVAGSLTGNTVARQQAQTAASSQVSGPLGIFFILKGGASVGFKFVLMIIAIISLTLAIMNVLPVPALDGGRLYLMLLSRLTRQKRLTQKAEETIVGWSFMILLLLIALITFVDIKRFI